MPDTSPRLDLPYVQPSQAQKHVTHNMALQRLDALVQLSVLELGAETPPPTPEAGDLYALGPAPTAAWAGQDGQLALWDGTAWEFLPPQDGWRGLDLSSGQAIVYDAGFWRNEILNLDNLDGIGIATSADTVNRLALASEASLFSHAGGGHQIKLNKATSSDTASLLFQSDWTGHAEIGLAGDTAFAVKISADGSNWHTALRADPGTGTLALAPAGTVQAQLSDSALQLDVPLTGTTVQSSQDDTTLGKLTKVAAFGLGGQPTSLSMANALDTIAHTGWHRIAGADAVTVNAPHGAGGGVVLTECYSSANKFQNYKEVVGSASRHWVRTYKTGTWQPWQEIVSQASMVGTVSETAGAPTGAVIESGSNANGAYIRYADGTQICWFEGSASLTTAPHGGVHKSQDIPTWVFPASFNSTPDQACFLNMHSDGQWGVAGTVSATQVSTGVVWSPTALTAASRNYSFMAIGRWF